MEVIEVSGVVKELGDVRALDGVAAMAQMQSGARFSDWGVYLDGEWDQWANDLWLQNHARQPPAGPPRLEREDSQKAT